MNKLFFGLLISFMLFSCAGKDILDTDKTPPQKPHLIAHLGDTGITYNQSTGQPDNYFNSSGFEDNGADAVDVAGNVTQITWDVLPDTDIDYLEVWRFNLNDTDTLLINTLHNYNKNYYMDNFSNLEVTPIGEDWFYYLKVFDTSGNFSVSDTVCYHLLSKPRIIAPDNSITVSDFNSITFSWYISPGSVFYLLIFDENFNLLKSYLTTDAPGDTYNINFTDLAIDDNLLQNKNKLYWEIVVSEPPVIRTVNGKDYTVYSGSESQRGSITKSKKK